MYDKLSVFWRIENFSLLRNMFPVESAPFSLPWGKETRNTTKFRIIYKSALTIEDAELQLCSFNDSANRPTEDPLPNLRVSFSALFATGEYTKFHDGGIIKNGDEVEDCQVPYKTHFDLLENRMSHLPDDSLTFLVQFTADETVFEVDRLSARTWVRIEKVPREWKIDDLSKNYRSSVPGKPFSLEFKSANTSRKEVYEVVVLPRYDTVLPIVCDLFLKKDCEELIVIEKFVIFQKNYERFAISKTFCETHANRALQKAGSLTLYFEFKTEEGIPVSEDFREGEENFSDCNETWNLLSPITVPDSPKQIDRIKADGKELGAGYAGSNYSGSEDDDHVDNTSSAKVPEIINGTGECAGFLADLVSDLNNLYTLQILSDFTLNVGSKSFPVHRAILSVRSVVFRAMFEAGMREKKENCSEVTDVDTETMDRMLRFVYSNEFGDLDVDGSSKLFAAADKYQIESLKSRCVESLVTSLSVENVCRVLSLADMHSDQTLMSRANEFLFRNADAVFRGDEWRQLMTENLELASNIMHEKLLKQQEHPLVQPEVKSDTCGKAGINKLEHPLVQPEVKSDTCGKARINKLEHPLVQPEVKSNTCGKAGINKLDHALDQWASQCSDRSNLYRDLAPRKIRKAVRRHRT